MDKRNDAPTRAADTSTPDTSVTRAVFGDLMAELPSGVAIVTTRGPSGPMGLAVTSLTAYTATPPSVLVSVAHTSRSCDPLGAAEHFGVHLLRRGQDEVAAVFASKAEDKFTGLDWWWDGDVPRLAGALAYLRCQKSSSFTHLDHDVIIGVIEEVERVGDVDPMLYLRRGLAWKVTA